MTGIHTLGPWFFDTNLHIYGTTTEHPHVCTAKTVGDVRLIAAAPELLEALRDLELVANTVAACYDRNPGNFAAALADSMRYTTVVRAAIAKATGSAS